MDNKITLVDLERATTVSGKRFFFVTFALKVTIGTIFSAEDGTLWTVTDHLTRGGRIEKMAENGLYAYCLKGPDNIAMLTPGQVLSIPAAAAE